MRKLYRYIREYKKECVLAPAFKLLEALMDLIVPLVVAGIINRGIAQADFGQVIRYFILLVVLAAAGMLFSFTAQFFAAKASVGFATNLRQALFDHIQGLSFGSLDAVGTDTLITRMTSDVNQVQNGVNLALRLLLRSPFIVFGAMIMAFTVDVPGAMVFAVAIPILCLVVFGIMLASIPIFSRVQSSLDKLTGITRENLTGVRVIRAFGREADETAEFDARNGQLTALNEFVGRLSALMNPATYVIVNIAAIVLIRQGALRVNLGVLRQGDVVALYNYMAQIIVELIKMASLIITINKSLACGRRIRDILEVEPGMSFPGETAPARPSGTGGTFSSGDNASPGRNASPGGNKEAPAVSFDHVFFSYAGSGDDAVEDICFTAGRGETVGIIGGTGSGKSTIVNLIARFYDADRGQVALDGIPIAEYPKSELNRRIGTVPQKAVLFAGTIRDNLKLGNEAATDEELWEALDTAQAGEVVKGKEGGLDAAVEQNGRNFSGGQRQRLTIARALAKHPEILILDDSASALDMVTDRKLRQALQKDTSGMTVFIVSQRTSSVRDADHILVLDDGKLAGDAPHDVLMRECPVYQEIYYSQYPEEKYKEKKREVTA